jgi:hypothetical protein
LGALHEVARVDLFGGYSHQTLNSSSGGGPGANGWAADMQANFGSSFSLVTAFSGVSGSQFGADLKLHSFLMGPRLTFRTRRGNIFVHTLVGGALLKASAAGVEDQSSGLATAMGGGVDVRLKRRISFRVQTDYLMTEIAQKTQNNIRFSTGLVYRPRLSAR